MDVGLARFPGIASVGGGDAVVSEAVGESGRVQWIRPVCRNNMIVVVFIILETFEVVGF